MKIPPPNQPHKWDDSFNMGNEGEDEMRDFFMRSNPHLLIEKAEIEDELMGIDLWLYDPVRNRRWSVQIKTDWKAGKTGNAFPEHISKGHFIESPPMFACQCGRFYSQVVLVEDIGWLWVCTADFIFYRLPVQDLVYEIKPDELRRYVRLEWRKRYTLKPAINEEYVTFGYPVPLDEFKKCARRIFCFSTGEKLQ